MLKHDIMTLRGLLEEKKTEVLTLQTLLAKERETQFVQHKKLVDLENEKSLMVERETSQYLKKVILGFMVELWVWSISIL